MAWAYVVFMVTGVGWQMLPGFYPLYVDDCQNKIQSMLPTFENITNGDQRIETFEAGCVAGEDVEALKEELRKRYPPGEKSS